MPLHAVIPLLQELTRRLQGHPNSAVLMVQWLKCVLTVHASYLSTLPDLVPQLGTLYQLMESRVKTFQKLSHLHGKLILLITQVTASEKTKGTTCPVQKAKLIYEEESSEEESDDEIDKDSDDNWDEDEEEKASEKEEEEEDIDEENEEEDEDAEENGEDRDGTSEKELNGDSDLDPENESEEEWREEKKNKPLDCINWFPLRSATTFWGGIWAEPTGAARAQVPVGSSRATLLFWAPQTWLCK